MEKAHTVSTDECELISFHLTPTAKCSSWPIVHLHIRVSLNYLAVTYPFFFFFFRVRYQLCRSVTLAMVLETRTSSKSIAIGVFHLVF